MKLSKIFCMLIAGLAIIGFTTVGMASEEHPKAEESKAESKEKIEYGAKSESEVLELHQEVITPQDMITKLINDIILLNLQKGISDSLDAKLYSSMNALDDTNENNDGSAINSLYEFINAVDAQRGKNLSETEANNLISAAQTIIDKLNAM